MNKSYAGDVKRLRAKSIWNSFGNRCESAELWRWIEFFDGLTYNSDVIKIAVVIIPIQQIIDPHISVAQNIELIFAWDIEWILWFERLMRNGSQFRWYFLKSCPRTWQQRYCFGHICENGFFSQIFRRIVRLQEMREYRFVLIQKKWIFFLWKHRNKLSMISFYQHR